MKYLRRSIFILLFLHYFAFIPSTKADSAKNSYIKGSFILNEIFNNYNSLFSILLLKLDLYIVRENFLVVIKGLIKQDFRNDKNQLLTSQDDKFKKALSNLEQDTIQLKEIYILFEFDQWELRFGSTKFPSFLFDDCIFNYKTYHGTLLLKYFNIFNENKLNFNIKYNVNKNIILIAQVTFDINLLHDKNDITIFQQPLNKSPKNIAYSQHKNIITSFLSFNYTDTLDETKGLLYFTGASLISYFNFKYNNSILNDLAALKESLENIELQNQFDFMLKLMYVGNAYFMYNYKSFNFKFDILILRTNIAPRRNDYKDIKQNILIAEINYFFTGEYNEFSLHNMNILKTKVIKPFDWSKHNIGAVKIGFNLAYVFNNENKKIPIAVMVGWLPNDFMTLSISVLCVFDINVFQQNNCLFKKGFEPASFNFNLKISF